MKVQLTRHRAGGMGGGGSETSVVELADDAPVPKGGARVADDTPVSDWAPATSHNFAAAPQEVKSGCRRIR